MKSRTLIILALALLLALSAATASARAVRTPFTGTSTVIDWPTNPDQRYWQPGPNAFWRGMWPIVQLDTTEPRISGTGCLIHDGNYRPAPGDACLNMQGTLHGTVRFEQDGDLDCSNGADGWEGSFTGIRYPDGLEKIKIELKGFGKYAGLHAAYQQASSGCWGSGELMQVEGEILDPNGD
jgi:hypothetical protein